MPNHHFDGKDPVKAPSKKLDVIKPASRQGGAPVSPAQNEFESYKSHQPANRGVGRPVKGLRFLSGLVDLIVVILLYFLTIIILTVMGAFAGEADLTDGEALLVFLSYIGICFAYGLFMECSRFQGTVGKIMTGTVIVNKEGKRISFGQSLGRNFGKWLSFMIPFYIAYLMVLWTQQSQSLHDKMAGTLVYKKGDVPQSYAETFAWL